CCLSLLAWLTQLWLFINGRFLIAPWKKGPAFDPPHVEGAISAVKIAADVCLFRLIAAIKPVLPYCRKRFKLETRHLCIRGVSGVSLQETAPGRKDSLRVFLFRPPQYLVHPVNAPIAKLPVRVVKKLAKALWVNCFIELAVCGRPAPHIPIEPGRRI